MIHLDIQLLCHLDEAISDRITTVCHHSHDHYDLLLHINPVCHKWNMSLLLTPLTKDPH